MYTFNSYQDKYDVERLSTEPCQLCRLRDAKLLNALFYLPMFCIVFYFFMSFILLFYFVFYLSTIKLTLAMGWFSLWFWFWLIVFSPALRSTWSTWPQEACCCSKLLVSSSSCYALCHFRQIIFCLFSSFCLVKLRYQFFLLRLPYVTIIIYSYHF